MRRLIEGVLLLASVGWGQTCLNTPENCRVIYPDELELNTTEISKKLDKILELLETTVVSVGEPVTSVSISVPMCVGTRKDKTPCHGDDVVGADGYCRALEPNEIPASMQEIPDLRARVKDLEATTDLLISICAILLDERPMKSPTPISSSPPRLPLPYSVR